MAAIVERYDCISSSRQMSATRTPPKAPEKLITGLDVGGQ